jgi:hypothetical protein
MKRTGHFSRKLVEKVGRSVRQSNRVCEDDSSSSKETVLKKSGSFSSSQIREAFRRASDKTKAV